jgi:aspartyl aminopeptidase
MGYIRSVLDKAGVLWHVAELGKVDVGGGGTVALFMANRNIDTVDAGVSVLGMHAPYEVTSKLDCYMTYRGMKAVFEQ